MKQKAARTAVCPRCGNVYHDPPALSRLDNKTLICPDCGTREALSSIGVETDEQDKIIGIIHSHTLETENGR